MPASACFERQLTRSTHTSKQFPTLCACCAAHPLPPPERQTMKITVDHLADRMPTTSQTRRARSGRHVPCPADRDSRPSRSDRRPSDCRTHVSLSIMSAARSGDDWCDTTKYEPDHPQRLRWPFGPSSVRSVSWEPVYPIRYTNILDGTLHMMSRNTRSRVQIGRHRMRGTHGLCNPHGAQH